MDVITYPYLRASETHQKLKPRKITFVYNN